MITFRVGILSCFIAITSFCGLFAKPLKPIVFQPDWFPNAQFSGFFWADTGGLYEKNGLDVTFNRFDFGVDFIGAVSSGEAAFGTVEAYILMDAIARGEPLVALGAVLGESPAGYIYLEKSGIKSGKDMEGKRVGVHNFAEELLPFFVQEAGLAEGSVEPVVVKHKIEKLLDGSVDLHQGYAIDEMIRLKGMTEEPVDILLFEELGMPMYSMVIYSSRAFVEANPEIVESFMSASAEGWEQAMAAPEITSLIVNGPFQDAEVDNALITPQAVALKDFVLIDGRPTLSMTRAKWEAMQAAYLKSGMIDAPVDLDALLEFNVE
jgi:ABC-type nitrate/sulfonate/bicarbonate transport system substrate-binding protein